MSLKDEKGEIMVREKPTKHNITLSTFFNLFLTLTPSPHQKVTLPYGD
jgi:hypothetical protein